MTISITQVAADFKTNTNRFHCYTLWGGEMVVNAQMHCGLHGFYSAALVIATCDGPMEVRSFSAYDNEPKEQGFSRTAEWITIQLNELATPKLYALAAGMPHSEVVKVE